MKSIEGPDNNREQKKTISPREIIKALSVEDVKEVYSGNVEIEDLKDQLGTEGHLLVIRGDRSYSDHEDVDENSMNPKFWLYENLINTLRIQEALRQNPEHKLFDGVGLSSLEALGYHAKKLNRKAVVVMAKDVVVDPEILDRYDIEIIQGDKPAEEGYIEKQAEVLASRDDLIPLHQALYGAQALAPVGNRVVEELKKLKITPEATVWCIASGSSLIGIGSKIEKSFPGVETVVVEPETNVTVDAGLDLGDKKAVKSFAREKLKNYSLDDWDKEYSGVFPLHVSGANRYLLIKWGLAGEISFDRVGHIPLKDVLDTQRKLAGISLDFNWTKTTALTITEATRLANEGKNVVVMSYGRYKDIKFRGLTLPGEEQE